MEGPHDFQSPTETTIDNNHKQDARAENSTFTSSLRRVVTQKYGKKVTELFIEN